MTPAHTGRLSGAADYLRASHISRWGIVRTAGTQSVAEHLYRVWTLVRQWGSIAGLNDDEQRLAEEWALLHDLPEIRTGDNPTPHKTAEIKAWLEQVETSICPEAIKAEQLIHKTRVYDFCKFCDTAEAILYLSVNGLGTHAADVTKLLREQMCARLDRSLLSDDAILSLLAAFNTTLDLT